MRDTHIKELVLCQSRQSGKSVFLEFACIYYMLQGNANIIYICPQFSQCRKVYKDLVKILTPTGLVKSANSSTLQIEIDNDSSISFFSAESPNAIRGNSARKLLVIDECAFCPDTTSDGQDFFNSIVMPVTKAYRPKIIYASTPLNKGSFFHKKFLDGQKKTYMYEGTLKHNRTYTIKADIYADSLLTADEIQEIKDSIPEASFKREFLCEFMSDGLSAFSDYDDKFTLNGQPDWNHAPLWVSVDFHSVGADSTVLSVINMNNDVWQYTIKGSLDSQYAQIAAYVDKCKKLVIAYMESNSIGSVMCNEIKKRCKQRSKIVEWNTTNESKETQVGLLQTLLSRDEIHFESANKTLKGQFDTFTYTVTKSRKISYAAIAGQHDDAVLSLMIGMQAKNDYGYSNGNNFVFIKSRTR